MAPVKGCFCWYLRPHLIQRCAQSLNCWDCDPENWEPVNLPKVWAAFEDWQEIGILATCKTRLLRVASTITFQIGTAVGAGDGLFTLSKANTMCMTVTRSVTAQCTCLENGPTSELCPSARRHPLVLAQLLRHQKRYHPMPLCGDWSAIWTRAMNLHCMMGVIGMPA
jgi:hypothetical protein